MITKTKPFDKLLESMLFGSKRKVLHEADEPSGPDDPADFTHARYDAGENAGLDYAAVQYNDLYTIYMELYEEVQGHLEAFTNDLLPAFNAIAQQAGAATAKITSLGDLVRRKDTALGSAKVAVEKLEGALETLGIDHADEKLDGEVAKVIKNIADLTAKTQTQETEIAQQQTAIAQQQTAGTQSREALSAEHKKEKEMYALMLSDYEELVRRIDLERRRALKLLEIANIRLEGRRTGSAWRRTPPQLHPRPPRAGRGSPAAAPEAGPEGGEKTYMKKKMKKKMKKFMAKENTGPYGSFSMNDYLSNLDRQKSPGDW